jgi:transcriptional regulator PpsR
MPNITISRPDITLLLDLEGNIQRATLADSLPVGGVDAWVGCNWADTVSDGAGDRVRNMVQDAKASGVSGFRTVNQRFPNGLELSVEYSTIRLGGDAGLIAIGKSQSTVTELQNRLVAVQHAREQDYWKLRDVETRYRMLFDTSSEPVLIVRADGFNVVEANLAALRALSITPGQDLLPELPPSEQDKFRVMLDRIRDQGRAPAIVVHLGVERAAWTMRASLLTSEPGQVFVLQLAPLAMPALFPSLAQSPSAIPATADLALPIDTLLERLPDAYVVIDLDGIVLRANAAFLDLVQVGSAGLVLGERLGRWLSRPGADLAVLMSSVKRHQYVRMFSTTLQSGASREIEVEISAAGNQEHDCQFVNLLIRDVSRRISSGASVRAPFGGLSGVSFGPGDQHAGLHANDPSLLTSSRSDRGQTLLAALGAMADDLGEASLPTLVKETVGLVERHYIEAALERADGNRTATAELLGLSRQSLYMKLNRYGLDTESQAALDHDQ